jgi:hypothetical protein
LPGEARSCRQTSGGRNPAPRKRTPTPRIDQRFTEKIRTEFIERGKYDIRSNDREADAVLSGTITSFANSPVGFTDQQLASRYAFTVTMRSPVHGSEKQSGAVVQRRADVPGEYDLRTRGTRRLRRRCSWKQEGPALDRLATDLARHVVSAIRAF